MMSEFFRIRGSEPSAGRLAAFMFTSVVLGIFSQKGTVNAASLCVHCTCPTSIFNILQALQAAHINIVYVIEGQYDLCDAKSNAAYTSLTQIPCCSIPKIWELYKHGSQHVPRISH